MYSGRQKTVSLPPLQRIALCFGVGLFVLILVLAGKRAFEQARESTSGLARGLTHGADRELNGSGTEGEGASHGLAHRSGASTGSGGFSTPPGQMVSLIPSPALGGTETAPFDTEAARRVAQDSLVPLHELLDSVRRFDSTVLSSPDGTAAGQTAGSGGGAANIPLLLDGLEAQTALVAHPYRFPTPLQDDAEQATREVYTYLETVRAGGIGQGSVSGVDEATVRATAQKHLQKSAFLVARMDTLAQGGSVTDGGGLTVTTSYSGPLP